MHKEIYIRKIADVYLFVHIKPTLYKFDTVRQQSFEKQYNMPM